MSARGRDREGVGGPLEAGNKDGSEERSFDMITAEKMQDGVERRQSWKTKFIYGRNRRYSRKTEIEWKESAAPGERRDTWSFGR